jgi:hypothetical protein
MRRKRIFKLCWRRSKYLKVLTIVTILVRPITDEAVSEILTLRILSRLRGTRAPIKHERRDSAVVGLVWIHWVGEDSVRSTLATEVVAVFCLLSAKDLSIRKKGASVTTVKERRYRRRMKKLTTGAGDARL